MTVATPTCCSCCCCLASTVMAAAYTNSCSAPEAREAEAAVRIAGGTTRNGVVTFLVVASLWLVSAGLEVVGYGLGGLASGLANYEGSFKDNAPSIGPWYIYVGLALITYPLLVWLLMGLGRKMGQARTNRLIRRAQSVAPSAGDY